MRKNEGYCGWGIKAPFSDLVRFTGSSEQHSWCQFYEKYGMNREDAVNNSFRAARVKITEVGKDD